MKKSVLITVSATLVATALAACGGSGGGDAAGVKVCVNEYVTLPIFKEGLAGLKEGMSASGYGEDEVTYDIRNPEGDAATQQTIVSQFLRDSDCDVLLGLATPGAQAFLQPGRKAPLVFFASSAPVEAKLVSSLEAPGNNTTGVSDPLPVELELDAMLAIAPDVTRVGLIWKNGDSSGDALAARAVAAAKKVGIEVVESPIANPSETTQAARLLVGKVDAIQVAGDGPTVSGVAGILKVAEDAGLPVFGGTTESVEQGALVAGVYDYGALGVEAGKLVAKVLDSDDAGKIPVYLPEESAMSVNEAVLERLGLRVPDGLEVEYVGTSS
ncbi:ABC transporter substrate-binding protein [Nocardioides humi]|uniref:ABC transporter substrate-binding protein n=1 Tax=Nocardioides humi TaxID=449461 RepID=A0ABN1ZZR1_9ACTN|nr:ABC transporter substrate-binding protein [Nocardioides humi]